MAGPANVYVVENDKAKQHEIESLLSQRGYAVRSYSSAEDLLENTDLKTTGCILADAEIPMSGVGLLNRLREIDSALRLVITSENANVPMVVEAFDNGVSSFVEKTIQARRFISEH